MLEKLNSFTKRVQDLSDKPALTPSELKAQFDAAPEEVRVYLNKLIDALKLTTDGDSGADNIGATTITDLTGNTVQSILEGLKTYVDGRSYTKTESDKQFSDKGLGRMAASSSNTIELSPGASNDYVITFPAGRFTKAPFVTFSIFNQDIDEQYNVASSLVAISQTGATIRVKNKSTANITHVIVTWIAIESKE